MKYVTIYDSGIIMNSYEVNTIQAIDLISNVLSGTNYDIIITNKEEKKNK